ncbi:MAG: aminotransferase [Cycloclasticus sp. symbiont of Poecilosclerida sp. M]|nr:MAG: aminotransferase [Cycloclasticus sp. symbiont of Poecilosclerida sp. M]
MISTKISKRMGCITSFHVMDVMARAKTLEVSGRDIVHMEVGEPDFATAQPVIDEGIRFLRSGNVHYTKAQGLPQLREKIAQNYQQSYGVEVSPERIFITPGASGALSVALASLLDVGDEVLIADPGYPCNSNQIALFGGKVKAVNVTQHSNYQLSAKGVDDAWAESVKGVVIASPSNPTGTVIARDQLAELMGVVADKQGFLISDEIYHGLVYDGRATSALEISRDVFIANSFSKFYGMTGWRLGWLVVPDAAVDAANRLMQNLYIAAPTHSQYAALAAFNEDTQQILNARREEFQRRRDVLYAGLSDLGFVLGKKPEGAFYIYADGSSFTDDSYAFAIALLEKQGVAITPGIDFGSNGAKQHVRFAYTTSLERIELGLQRIKVFLES